MNHYHNATPATFKGCIERLEGSPATSYWLMEAVRELDKRDVLDALNDVETLCRMFQMKFDESCAELDRKYRSGELQVTYADNR